MIRNKYWLLMEKTKKPAFLIAELTADGIVYVWPKAATILKSSRPLNEDQDPEALLADGDFIQMSGYYNGVKDFLSHSKYTSDSYNVTFIGEYESIRSCRLALKTVM